MIIDDDKCYEGKKKYMTQSVTLESFPTNEFPQACTSSEVFLF